MVLSTVLLSEWTRAWLLYVGLAFMAVVMLAPQGLTGLALQGWRRAQGGAPARSRWPAALAGVCWMAVAGAGTALVEMGYHWRFDVTGEPLRWAGWAIDVHARAPWAAAGLAGAMGVLGVAAVRRRRVAPPGGRGP